MFSQIAPNNPSFKKSRPPVQNSRQQSVAQNCFQPPLSRKSQALLPTQTLTKCGTKSLPTPLVRTLDGPLSKTAANKLWPTIASDRPCFKNRRPTLRNYRQQSVAPNCFRPPLHVFHKTPPKQCPTPQESRISWHTEQVLLACCWRACKPLGGAPWIPLSGLNKCI